MRMILIVILGVSLSVSGCSSIFSRDPQVGSASGYEAAKKDIERGKLQILIGGYITDEIFAFSEQLKTDGRVLLVLKPTFASTHEGQSYMEAYNHAMRSEIATRYGENYLDRQYNIATEADPSTE